MFRYETGRLILMGRQSFRGEYCLQWNSLRKRPFFVSSAFVLFLRLGCVFVAGCIGAGCVSELKATSSRPVDATMEIISQALIEQHAMDTLCLLAFNSPPEMAAAVPFLTSTFQSRLVQRRVFRQIKVLPYVAWSDAEALWYARYAGCNLVMCPALLYMLDGTGGMPTELVVRIRILDATTGGVLWDVKQHGVSEPGPDIGLEWSTIQGEPAQRCRVLADCLARGFAEYLVQTESDQAQRRK
jgi:hypothetical protein